MENWDSFLKQLIEGMGFADYTIDTDAEHRHSSIFLHDAPMITKESVPAIVESINHLIQLVARKRAVEPLFVDINNYRKEREQLIVELTRATARKVVATKTEIPLPVMNSYERRLAHMELSAHPDVTTESIGKGHGRYVVVRPISDTPTAVPATASE